MQRLISSNMFKHGIRIETAMKKGHTERQGISSEKDVKHDILVLALDRKKRGCMEFVNPLKDEHTKVTIIKHLQGLVDAGLMTKEPGSSEESFKPKYSITEKGKKTFLVSLKDMMQDSAKILAAAQGEPKEAVIRTVEDLLTSARIPYRIVNEKKGVTFQIEPKEARRKKGVEK